MKILIVDDSASTRGLVASYLDPFGTVDHAADGKEAVEMFERALREHKPYDLVVMDLIMPVMNGIEAMRAIRDMEHTLGLTEITRSKIVTLSSLTDSEPMLTAQLECEADTYITKPFEKEVLMEALVNLNLAKSPPEPNGSGPAAH